MEMDTMKNRNSLMKSIIILSLLVVFMSGCSSHTKLFSSDKVIYHEDSVTTRAEFPGGREAYFKYLKDKKITTPSDGHGIYSFVVNQEGFISDVKVEKKFGYSVDKTIVNIFKEMPQWTPATLNGKPVSVRVVRHIISNIKNRPAIFPGGYHSFLDEYWNILVTPGMRGNVKVEFIVDETGEVRNPRVIQGLNPRANALALRIVRRMPRWEPAIKKGKPIQSTETISIFFRKGKDDFGTMKDHFAPQNNRR